MLRKAIVAAAFSAVAVVGVGGTAAFAGEVTGPPGSVENPPATKDMSHPNSICAFSGLNDFVDGPTDFHVQSYGQDVRAGRANPREFNPGAACRGGSNPARP
jgi:hypothetical protein